MVHLRRAAAAVAAAALLAPAACTGSEGAAADRPQPARSFTAGAPGGGAWWHSAASHPKLPRGGFGVAGDPIGSLETLLFGPADEPDGQLNLFGGLRRAMAKCGYRDVKEFQKVGLVLDR